MVLGSVGFRMKGARCIYTQFVFYLCLREECSFVCLNIEREGRAYRQCLVGGRVVYS